MYVCICMFVYVCMYMYACIYMYVYVCMYMYVCMYVCICMCVCMYVVVCVCMHTCICMYAYNERGICTGGNCPWGIVQGELSYTRRFMSERQLLDEQEILKILNPFALKINFLCI